LSLSRIVVFFITCLVTIYMLASGVLSTMHARQYFSKQMQVLADDTASILGFALTQAAAKEDYASMESSIDAIFDSGFYRSIVYSNVRGEPEITRVLPLKIDGVPQWFIRVVDIPNFYGQAEISSGWYQRGKVHVSCHPGYAYKELWDLLSMQLQLSLMVLLLGYLLSFFILQLVLRPIQKISEFSEKIATGNFSGSVERFFAKELNRLAVSMNKLNSNLGELVQGHIVRAEKLQSELTRDRLTGLMNRHEFDKQVGGWLASAPQGSPCAICLIKLDGLIALNNELGQQGADEWILRFSSGLEKLAQHWQPVWIARRSGTEFSVFIPGVFLSDLEKLCTSLLDGLKAELQGVSLSTYLGAVYANSGFSLLQMVSGADSALRRSTVLNGKSILNLEDETEALGIRPPQEWLARLREIIELKQVELEYQAIKNRAGNVSSMECLARIPEPDGRLSQAVAFWPLVERYCLAEALDKIVFTKALAQVVRFPSVQWRINISSSSIKSTEFNLWLGHQLTTLGDAAKKICFELNVDVASMDQVFLDVVNRSGASISLQNFGRSPTALSMLKTLPLSSVKLDPWFTDAITKDVGLKFYVESLVEIIHGCDVNVVATGIESEEQWQMFLSMGVDAAQGYHISPPIQEV